MIKVLTENTYIKENVIIDPYIPIKIKFGNFYSWEDPTKYVRLGDFKSSMLEIGFSEEKGIIQHIALICAKDIYINKINNLKTDNSSDGLIVFKEFDLENKRYTDVYSKLVVTTGTDNITICFSGKEVVEIIQNGKVKFGLSEDKELCLISVFELSVEEIKKLNGCLEYMLEHNL